MRKEKSFPKPLVGISKWLDLVMPKPGDTNWTCPFCEQMVPLDQDQKPAAFTRGSTSHGKR